MNEEANEAYMIAMADKMSFEFSKYNFKSYSRQGYGEDVPFLLLAFCFAGEMCSDEERVDAQELEIFYEKTADYIVVEGLKIRRKGLLITTAEYRRSVSIIKKLVNMSSNVAAKCIDYYYDDGNEDWDDEDEYLREHIDSCLKFFYSNFNNSAHEIKIPTIDEKKKIFITTNCASFVRAYLVGF